MGSGHRDRRGRGAVGGTTSARQLHDRDVRFVHPGGGGPLCRAGSVPSGLRATAERQFPPGDRRRHRPPIGVYRGGRRHPDQCRDGAVGSADAQKALAAPPRSVSSSACRQPLSRHSPRRRRRSPIRLDQPVIVGLHRAVAGGGVVRGAPRTTHRRGQSQPGLCLRAGAHRCRDAAVKSLALIRSAFSSTSVRKVAIRRLSAHHSQIIALCHLFVLLPVRRHGFPMWSDCPSRSSVLTIRFLLSAYWRKPAIVGALKSLARDDRYRGNPVTLMRRGEGPLTTP